MKNVYTDTHTNKLIHTKKISQVINTTPVHTKRKFLLFKKNKKFESIVRKCNLVNSNGESRCQQ